MAAVDTEESKLLLEAEGTSRLPKTWEEKQTNKQTLKKPALAGIRFPARICKQDEAAVRVMQTTN